MGEYEDRYPDAYGPGDDTAAKTEGRQSAETSRQPRRVWERPLFRRLGMVARAERTEAWEHRPMAAASAPSVPEPVEMTPGAAKMTRTPPTPPYRGRGPRGYVRTAERIRDDLCDRLTENPFIDASDIEVTVNGSEVALEGTVDSEIAYKQTQAIAEEVIGVTHVHNHLTIRPGGGEARPTPGDTVNQFLGTRRR